jgi:hypothetical protein
MFITDQKKLSFPDPGSRISDLGLNNKTGGENTLLSYLIVDINLDKNDKYYSEH